MTSDIAHWLVTAIIGAFAFVLWWIFTNMNGKVAALELQNAAQERELATLKATQTSHSDGFEDVKQEIRALSGKVDQVLINLGRRPTPYGSGGDGGRKT
jgi:cell division protein FtsB